DHVNHAAALLLVERQAAGEDGGALRGETHFEIVGTLWPRVRADEAAAVDGAEEGGALVAPGEAGAVIGVPAIAGGGLRRLQLDVDFEQRPAHPGAEPLPIVGEHLVLVADEDAFGD